MHKQHFAPPRVRVLLHPLHHFVHSLATVDRTGPDRTTPAGSHLSVVSQNSMAAETVADCIDYVHPPRGKGPAGAWQWKGDKNIHDIPPVCWAMPSVKRRSSSAGAHAASSPRTLRPESFDAPLPRAAPTAVRPRARAFAAPPRRRRRRPLPLPISFQLPCCFQLPQDPALLRDVHRCQVYIPVFEAARGAGVWLLSDAGRWGNVLLVSVSSGCRLCRCHRCRRLADALRGSRRLPWLRPWRAHEL